MTEGSPQYGLGHSVRLGEYGLVYGSALDRETVKLLPRDPSGGSADSSLCEREPVPHF